VYPNPANNILNYTNPSNIVVQSAIITDVSGKIVANYNSSISDSIDVSNLQSGVYFIKFVSEEKTIIRKFVKN
jgi:hypothetical protein